MAHERQFLESSPRQSCILKELQRLMRLQWTQDLDIETLEARGHWAAMEELMEVVKLHLPRYVNTVKMCKETSRPS